MHVLNTQLVVQCCTTWSLCSVQESPSPLRLAKGTRRLTLCQGQWKPRRLNGLAIVHRSLWRRYHIRCTIPRYILECCARIVLPDVVRIVPAHSTFAAPHHELKQETLRAFSRLPCHWASDICPRPSRLASSRATYSKGVSDSATSGLLCTRALSPLDNLRGLRGVVSGCDNYRLHNHGAYNEAC